MNKTTIEANKTSCALSIPFAIEFLSESLPIWARGLLGVLGVITIFSVLVFVEEILFISRNFRKGDRRIRTLWILALFPMFTLTSFLSLLVPRSGTIVNLVANTFFASVIYQTLELIIDYLGGRERMWTILEESRPISLRTPPLCCCCLCLPEVTLTRKSFEKFYNLVMQVAIVRPLLMFIAAILWTDNTYIPGNLIPTNAFLYVAVGNFASTVLSIWGLVILKTGFRLELEEQYSITGKVFCVQLTLFSTSATSIICGILATVNVIRCNTVFSSRARGDVLFHMVLVVLVTLYGLLARFFYRRASDGAENDCLKETRNIALKNNAGDAEAGGGRTGNGKARASDDISKDPNSNDVTTTDKDIGKINEAATVHEDNPFSNV